MPASATAPRRSPTLDTITARLRRAQQKALADGPGIDRLYLNPVQPGIPGLDVHSLITAARAHLTVEGAASVEVTLEDPDWLVESSQLLELGSTGHLKAIDVSLNGLAYRLVKASRETPEQLVLTFEDRVVSYLRQHRKPKTWSRGSVTRAQAIEAMVREVKQGGRIPFYSPEVSHKQPVERPDYPETAPPVGETGFDKDTKVKVKGRTANAQQLAEIATAMGVAAQLNAGPRATLAMAVAGIGESGFQAIRNQGNPPSPYWGVFQGNIHTFKLHDTEGMARSFLKGGKGFQAGGAIALARAEPGISVGAIATRVEASGEAPAFYDKYHDEGAAIVNAFSGGEAPTDDQALYVKSYQFMRGYPDGPKGEDSWLAMQRLAEEVRWRAFAAGGVVVYASDDWLITTPASFVLADPLGPGLLARPTYDWDHGKLAGEVELAAHAESWSVSPGAVVALLGSKWGPISGRWLVKEIDQNLLENDDCRVTLTKPLKPLPEPAPEIGTLSSSANPTSTKGPITTKGGAKGIVDQCAAIAEPFGTYVGSSYRPGATTTSGNPSDHGSNDEHQAARDIGVAGIDLITGPPSPRLDKAVEAIGKGFGRLFSRGETIIETFNFKGYRVQVIWRTAKYGGHLGHIHVGAKKL